MRFRPIFSFWFLLSVACAGQSSQVTAGDCRGCHWQAATQPSTTMGHALETVEQSKILIEHPVLETVQGKYRYRIERKGDQSIYSVTDGTNTISMPIRWAVGASFAIGQTYILEKDGEWYESRVSWFRELKSLGPTLGSQDIAPTGLADAVGRRMSHDDKIRCMACHATNAVSGQQLTLQSLAPGVQCAHCHANLDAHVSAEEGLRLPAHETQDRSFQLKNTSAEEVSDFCGNCHRTWAEIAAQGKPGIANVRFQPYRLTESKCFDPYDKRISCIACHDPHKEVDSISADYTAKCLACHGGAKSDARSCRVSKSNCVSCHMPKLELPGAHYRFTDHRIRIVKPGEPYPG
ncbi:MAG TPA: multiheme c-type cytochrome [Terracidiphilus sp.]|nr:multiheme c-type cytochrome [Terracidiphilus sp.]